jgi:hypothetical protein
MKLGRRIAGLLAVASIAFYVSYSANSEESPKPGPYPHLNSYENKAADYDLSPEEAAWLEKQIDAGKLRVATPEDIQAWKDLAQETGNTGIAFIDNGRNYVVLDEIEIPRNINNSRVFVFGISFIVPTNVKFPNDKISTPVYDLKTGGAVQSGMCFVNGIKGYGTNPRNCKPF